MNINLFDSNWESHKQQDWKHKWQNKICATSLLHITRFCWTLSDCLKFFANRTWPQDKWYISKEDCFSILRNDSPEYRYQELVTPYAWAYILKQFSLRSEVKLEQKKRLYGQLQQAKAKWGSSKSYSCIFHQSVLLPCRHILKLREVNHENLFVEAVSDRWKINTVRTSHRLFDDTSQRQIKGGGGQASPLFGKKMCCLYRESLKRDGSGPLLGQSVGPHFENFWIRHWQLVL